MNNRRFIGFTAAGTAVFREDYFDIAICQYVAIFQSCGQLLEIPGDEYIVLYQFSGLNLILPLLLTDSTRNHVDATGLRVLSQQEALMWS